MRIPITLQTILPHTHTYTHNGKVEEMYNAVPHTELNILSILCIWPGDMEREHETEKRLGIMSEDGMQHFHPYLSLARANFMASTNYKRLTNVL